jgi:phospholipase/carboxylesterase
MAFYKQTLQLDQWVARTRQPEGRGPFPVYLLLHGLSGDEDVMWVFASRLPSQALLIAPRGLHSSTLGGYSWLSESGRKWPLIVDFQPAVEAILELLNPNFFPAADFSNLHLVGFSQGAALSYTFGLLQGGNVQAFAGLSGFLPEDAPDYIARKPLRGKRIFAAHGTQDDTVPVERARWAVQILEQAGAQVVYCEDDVGHKLSASCFKGLEGFFKNNEKTD